MTTIELNPYVRGLQAQYRAAKTKADASAKALKTIKAELDKAYEGIIEYEAEGLVEDMMGSVSLNLGAGIEMQVKVTYAISQAQMAEVAAAHPELLQRGAIQQVYKIGPAKAVKDYRQHGASKEALNALFEAPKTTTAYKATTAK